MHLYSCEYENMGDISSGPAAGYLHSAGCLPYCPEESQSCFLSSKMFLQILLSSLHLQDVLILLLVCFLICFFWIIWGQNIHKEELSAFCKIKRWPSMVATRKTTLWFSAVYKSIPSLYCVFLAHQHGHKYNFTTALEKPTEYNKNAVCFKYCTSSPHQVNHKTKRSQCGLECSVSIWIICEHFISIKSWFCVSNTDSADFCVICQCFSVCFRLLKSTQPLASYILSRSVVVQKIMS